MIFTKFITRYLAINQTPITQYKKFIWSGDGLCVGYASGDNVSDLFKSPEEFQGGTIEGVDVAVEGKPYIDLEAEAKRILMTP